MPGSDDSRTITGYRTASKFYRRPPGAAWLVGAVGNSTAAGADRLGRPEQAGRGRQCHAAERQSRRQR